MSNSFNIDVKPEIAAAVVKIEANTGLLTTIDSIVDSIKLKTDATPQNVRGTIYEEYLFTESPTFVDVVNVSGQGKLLMLSCLLMVDTDEIDILLTLDGTTFVNFTHTGDLVKQFILPYLDILYPMPSLFSIVEPLTSSNIFNMEFDTSLRVQSRRSSGTGDVVKCAAIYQLDEF